jgi:hypothetical protein
MADRQRTKLRVLADPLQFKLKLYLLDTKDGAGCEDAEREWHRLALMCTVKPIRNENCGTNMVLKNG